MCDVVSELLGRSVSLSMLLHASGQMDNIKSKPNLNLPTDVPNSILDKTDFMTKSILFTLNVDTATEAIFKGIRFRFFLKEATL